MSGLKKISSIVVAVILLSLVGAFYFHFYFVFGEGVKAGDLNRIVNKGIIFKTYEGRVIQTGFSSERTNNAGVQSNEFIFSVDDKKIADSLMYHCGGKTVELHYKEYRGALPWRGKEKFVVDSIIAVR